MVLIYSKDSTHRREFCVKLEISLAGRRLNKGNHYINMEKKRSVKNPKIIQERRVKAYWIRSWVLEKGFVLSTEMKARGVY